MSDTTTTDSGEDPFEGSPLTPDRIGFAAGVMDVAVFAFLGHVLFEDPVVGAVSGLLVGIGVYLFLSSFLAGDFEEGDDARDAAVDPGTDTGFHRPAAGLALGPAGIVLFAWRFTSEDVLIGATGALVFAAVAYVVLSRVLPDP
ncbi:hypothetical protein OB955_21325 [Halobacteria archaeon AArc-m2/3/4]|uniref:Uncharacterized protein n=1 Tax=Natronoglomus mannanivorans TaxID=2979990 RepID=A0AAP2Z3C9_9EURY|nr:hypothetical protein [Halobacteria archaeon AArc-xg1-1]MCU4975247.1 hypothetical protein [Halobacteria archaeon AArc-m2/3/4]